MRRLVNADLKRILCKPGLYLAVVIMLIIVLTVKASDTAADQMEFYKAVFNSVGLIFICIPVFLSVYGDELKSGTMVISIGRGIPRRKIVRAKLQTCTILLTGSYLILFIGAIIKNSISGLVVTPRQNAFLFLYCIFCVLRGVGLFGLSSLVLFLTLSSAGGMLTLIIAGMAAQPVLQTIQLNSGIPAYDMSFLGLLDASFADFQAGGFGWKIIVAFIYLWVVIGVNIITFDRKELEL